MRDTDTRPAGGAEQGGWAVVWWAVGRLGGSEWAEGGPDPGQPPARGGGRWRLRRRQRSRRQLRWGPNERRGLGCPPKGLPMWGTGFKKTPGEGRGATQPGTGPSPSLAPSLCRTLFGSLMFNMTIWGAIPVVSVLPGKFLFRLFAVNTKKN